MQYCFIANFEFFAAKKEKAFQALNIQRVTLSALNLPVVLILAIDSTRFCNSRLDIYHSMELFHCLYA